MDAKKAIKHLQTLLKVALECDDIDTVHRLLREMQGVLSKVDA